MSCKRCSSWCACHWVFCEKVDSEERRAGGSTFGLKAYGSSSTDVNGPGGAYKVDALVNKPAYASFKQALAS